MNAARWKAHVVNPYSQCLRCKKQYTSSDVMMELDGSLEDPLYVRGTESQPGGENVFNLSLSVGSELLNMLIRLLVSEAWWPEQRGIERNLVTGRTKAQTESCGSNCTIRNERWTGDTADPIKYIRTTNGGVNDVRRFG